jgi:hypothetical protein
MLIYVFSRDSIFVVASTQYVFQTPILMTALHDLRTLAPLLELKVQILQHLQRAMESHLVAKTMTA